MKKQGFKDGDWVFGYEDCFGLFIEKINKCIYWRCGFRDPKPKTIWDDSSFLTIRSEAMQKKTVIHCPEKWMAEALCWVMNKLGKRWCNGESFLANTQWKYYQEKICYNFYDRKFGEYSYYKDSDYKIIQFWDAVCGKDSIDVYNNNKGENVMGEEKKYEWCKYIVNSVSICNVLIKIPECKAKEEFKAWCFDRRYTYDKVIFFSSSQGVDLLSELHKPNRKAWLNYAIKQGYVKEVEPEETFSIGDVLELENVSVADGAQNKYIINICASKMVCLNSINGTRWTDMFSVLDIDKITYDEIYQNTKTHFKKVGHGAKNLI